MSVLTNNYHDCGATLSNAENEDLGYQTFVMKSRHLLTEASRPLGWKGGRSSSTALKARGGGEGGNIRFFSDRQFFTVAKIMNRQNGKWTCRDPSPAPHC